MSKILSSILLCLACVCLTACSDDEPRTDNETVAANDGTAAQDPSDPATTNPKEGEEPPELPPAGELPDGEWVFLDAFDRTEVEVHFTYEEQHKFVEFYMKEGYYPDGYNHCLFDHVSEGKCFFVINPQTAGLNSMIFDGVMVFCGENQSTEQRRFTESFSITIYGENVPRDTEHVYWATPINITVIQDGRPG